MPQPPRQLVLDNEPWSGGALTESFEQTVAAAYMSFDGRRKLGALKVHGTIGGLITDDSFVSRNIKELPGVELFVEFAVKVIYL